MNVHYLAALSRGPVRAVARVRRRSAGTVVVQVDVSDGWDEVGAIATITFAVRIIRDDSMRAPLRAKSGHVRS